MKSIFNHSNCYRVDPIRVRLFGEENSGIYQFSRTIDDKVSTIGLKFIYKDLVISDEEYTLELSDNAFLYQDIIRKGLYKDTKIAIIFINYQYELEKWLSHVDAHFDSSTVKAVVLKAEANDYDKKTVTEAISSINAKRAEGQLLYFVGNLSEMDSINQILTECLTNHLCHLQNTTPISNSM